MSETTIFKDIRVQYHHELNLHKGKLFFAGFQCRLIVRNEMAVHNGVWIIGKSNIGTYFDIMSGDTLLGTIMLEDSKLDDLSQFIKKK